MVECIFTIDYEIYGDGRGRLDSLIFHPAAKLMRIFRNRGVRFVAFVEVAELEMIESRKSDPCIEDVRLQVREMHEEGFELGLHLHPQWFGAQYDGAEWHLNFEEYNLCLLDADRIRQIVDRSVAYLQDVTGQEDLIPLSFRAGNWLFQPSEIAARILWEKGVRIDSSVFKGGLQTQHGLDYRRAERNGYFWKFSNQVDVPDEDGKMMEIPIFTRMVPFWRMLTGKRVGLQKKSRSSKSGGRRYYRDYLRWQYPLKFDFCRMTISELEKILDEVMQADLADPSSYKPIVAIGHTKDLVDFETVDTFLSQLQKRGVPVVTFRQVLDRVNDLDLSQKAVFPEGDARGN